jgi:hypothetical protein
VATSTIYSMGTALDRAQANDLEVDVLVSGVWLSGRVIAADGHGVVLETSDHEHAVARLEAVLAVRVHSDVPARVTIPAQAQSY